MSTLPNKGRLLAMGGDIESTKGFIECINPLRTDVKLLKLVSVYH
jgi:hypothetical protein